MASNLNKIPCLQATLEYSQEYSRHAGKFGIYSSVAKQPGIEIPEWEYSGIFNPMMHQLGISRNINLNQNKYVNNLKWLLQSAKLGYQTLLK